MDRNNLLELDIDKLFEEHKIEEIIEIKKKLDAEIERKRVDLRSMVGDRYKDVLAASDAIKNMKTISQDIVDNIQKIADISEELISDTCKGSSQVVTKRENINNEERTLIIQVRLVIFMNEQVWTALDKGDNLTAAQFYLLAQHIHMGLNLTRKEYLSKLPLLKQVKANLQTLKDQIFLRIKLKLESVEITAEETSGNLNALLLLKGQSTRELLNIFIEHRKIALNTVMNTAHSSVRVQISAMVRCLITTIHLLHDCFICYRGSKTGLIWQQLQNIVEDSSTPTLSKFVLPVTPLTSYIPIIVKEFKPKHNSASVEYSERTVELNDWLESTIVSIRNGLDQSLKLITNVKGLQTIREESLKIDLPPEWEQICLESNLPVTFNVWSYFFQDLITDRAKELISSKVTTITREVEKELKNSFHVNPKSEQRDNDLRCYTWIEDPADISRRENDHIGLSMKTLGFSQNIVKLCEKLDTKYLELFSDVSQYLYEKDVDDNTISLEIQMVPSKHKKKVKDKEELEKHLRAESTKTSIQLTTFLQEFIQEESSAKCIVMKSLMAARFLQAITTLCPNFKKCCTFSGPIDGWQKICTSCTDSSIMFWQNWVDKCVLDAEREIKKQFTAITVSSMICVLLRWDTIDIQEQTDEKIFKSQIKVPLKPSLVLTNILNKLNDDLSYVLPQTLPKQIHLQFVERNVEKILQHYQQLTEKELNQNQALQFLFDVKFLTTFCIQRENHQLVSTSQEICDKLRARIDPFDLDVFYAYIQTNVKRAVLQSQVILGCLLPSSVQLANLGISEKVKDQEKEPSVLALCVPSVTFPMFSTFAHQIPSQRVASVSPVPQTAKFTTSKVTQMASRVSQDPTAAIRSSAAALFGGITSDWFS